MAKKANVQPVRLVAKDENGKVTHHYYTMKNIKENKEKIKLRKYNPRTRQHEMFEETKVSSGKK